MDDWYSSFTDDSSGSALVGTTSRCGTRHTAWMASVPLKLANHPTHVVLDLGCTLSIGSRAAIKRFQERALYYGITTAFCRSSMSFVFANSATETCFESCIIHSPTRVHVLETGDVPILFSFSQMKNRGATVELDPKGDTLTCPAFGMCLFSADCSTMDHLVLDFTSLA